MSGPAAPARTLVALHHGEPTGPSRSLRPLMDWLISHGGEVGVLVPWRGAHRPVPDELGVTVLPFSPLTFPTTPRRAVATVRAAGRDARRLRAVVRARRPDLLLASSGTIPAVLVAARLEGVPSILYLGECFSSAGGRGVMRTQAGRAVSTASAALAHAVVCPSDAVRNGLPPGLRRRAHTVPVAIGLGPPAAGSGARFRAEHGIRADALCLTLVGSVSRGRGHDVLVRAVSTLRTQGVPACCALVGAPHPRESDLRYHAEVSELARVLGVQEHVHWCGFVMDPVPAFAASDIVVNPVIIPEAASRASLEAVTLGRPLIASRAGGIPEMLRDQEDCLLVEPGNSDEIVGAVRRLREERGLTERLSRSAIARVRERHAPERARDAMVQIVEQVLGG